MIALLSRAARDKVDIWAKRLQAAMPEEQVVIGPPHRDWPGDLSEIDIAVVADPPPEILYELPSLRLAQSIWAGVDGLIAAEAIPPGVPLVRLIDPALAEDMAEYVMANLLWLHRQHPLYARQQREHRWQQHHQVRAPGRHIGLLGAGEMGRAVARHARAFGFPVTAWARTPRTSGDFEVLSGADGLRAVLAQAEILVNLLPLTPETQGILRAETLALLPAGAAIISAGRGQHIIIADLLAALDNGRLGHAVLDVFPDEPLPGDHPLWSHEKVTITPHVAAATDPETASKIIASNVGRFRRGLPFEGIVNAERGY